MRIGKFYEGIEIHRENKMVYAKFLNPHRTLSTCRVNGGLREDLKAVFNHQACEPNKHFRKSLDLAISNPESYLANLCRNENLPSEKSACLSTATNMNYAVIESTQYRDIEVIAVATAGVETNAIRAADPASYHEINGTVENLDDHGNAPNGTINIMLFINKELIPGMMAAAMLIATEAKTAAMQELLVNSRYSSGLATGTGTDQIAVASNLNGDTPLRHVDKHSKLGECIGATVKGAVKKSLGLHNAFSPPSRARVAVYVERFGIDFDDWVARVAELLPRNKAAVLRYNFEGLNRDPLVVAAVASIIHLRDQLTWGILPVSCLADVWCAHGAQIAAAVSGKYHRIPYYRDCLALGTIGINDDEIIEHIAKSIALGFVEKWDE